MESHVQTPSQLAVVLKSRRRMSGQTQVKAASRVGLLPKTVSALENRPGTVSLESLFKLLAALDLELVVRDRGGSRGTTSSEEW